MQVIEWNQECKPCEGTGLYIGMAEHHGAAVVCTNCKGAGEVTMRFEYNLFTGRKSRPNVEHVYAASCGIGLAPHVTPGGVPVEEWEKDPQAPYARGNELREHTCPAWWNQTVGGDKPNWPECRGNWGLPFTSCAFFPVKANCWAQYDREAQV